MVMSFLGSAAPTAAFVAINRRRAERSCTARGRSAAEDGGPRLSCLARNAGFSRQGKKAAGPPLRDRAACRPIALLEGRGASSSDPEGVLATDLGASLGGRLHAVTVVAKDMKRTTSCGTSCWRTDA